MLQPHTPPEIIGIKRLLAMLPGFIAMVFIVTALLTSPLLKNMLMFEKIQDALTGVKAEAILELMSYQTPYLTKVLPESYESTGLGELSFQAVTNINFEDERSLLGSELPGFSIFDTEILVASEGVNYTNVPIESPPPMDTLREQRSQHQQDDGAKPPPQEQEEIEDASVFIYSSHSWESYLPLLGLAGAKDANKATSYDADENILKVGRMLEEELEQAGVSAVANQTKTSDILFENDWEYPQSYKASRSVVAPAVKSNKSYDLFLDLHRDSLRQEHTTVTINNESYAAVSFIIGAENQHAEKNRHIADWFHEQLNEQYPGLSRGVFGKDASEGNGVYNQDLSPRVLLIEMGGVDNTKQELRNTVQALTDIISEYIKNAEKV